MNIILYKHSSFFLKRKKKKASDNFDFPITAFSIKNRILCRSKKIRIFSENTLGRRKSTLRKTTDEKSMQCVNLHSKSLPLLFLYSDFPSAYARHSLFLRKVCNSHSFLKEPNNLLQFNFLATTL